MKLVVVTEPQAEGGRIAAMVSEKDLWAFQVLVARAGQAVLAIQEELVVEEVVHAT